MRCTPYSASIGTPCWPTRSPRSAPPWPGLRSPTARSWPTRPGSAHFAQGASEALRPGAEGWTDETTAIFTAWDIDPEDVAVHIVWWHGRHDANVPLQAAERVVARIPSVDLQVWDAAGHLEGYHREEQLLAGLMSR